MFVTGEYNWGVQPGLKNLTDHFLECLVLPTSAACSHTPGLGAAGEIRLRDILDGCR